MSNISFDNVYLLLLAVPLTILCIIPFVIAVRKENRNGHNVASLILHIFMAALIAFAASGIYVSTVVTETHVYVVADVSYSAKSNLDKIDEYIRNLELAGNTKLGLVCFGKDYELVSELDDPRNVASVKEATVDDSETNVAAALKYTGTLFNTGVIKRIVLITDGKQTDISADNSIRRAVDGLSTQSIRVDAIFLDSNPDPESHTEVQISDVKATANAYLDSKQTATVTVQSSCETKATLSLERNGEAVEEDKDVYLTLGINIVEIELDTSEAGTFDYEVTITSENDASDRNNTYYFTQTVTDEMKVLVVTQNWSDCVAIIERYGSKGIVDVYENDTDTTDATKNNFLNSYTNDNVTVQKNTMEIPFSIEALCEYDEIILANVDISLFNNYYAFITNLKDAVYNFGKSLITMGNLYIQNRDFGDDVVEWDLFQTYEGMLPVKYGNGDDDPKLYTLVIDASRSMSHLFHMDIVKDLSTRLVKMLSDGDYISIFRFDGEVEAIYNAKSLKDRDEIIETINKIDVANGTVIGSGLQRAYEQIRNLSYSEKQVMLITDGVAFGADPYNPETVVASMYADDIVTSVFDVGRQGDRPNGSNVDGQLQKARDMLVRVANAGHGFYYYSNNPEYLDDVIFGEVADNMTESVIIENTTVNVEVPRDSIFEDINLRETAFPDVSGYVYSGLKPSATTVLTVNHKRASGIEVERPLYAHWQYGEGKVSTFTSSIGEWTAKWDSGIKKTFFDNMFDINVPQDRNENPYAVDIVRDGSETTVNVKLPTILPLRSSANVQITLPDGSTFTESMKSTGSSYRYTFNATELGKYKIEVTYTCDGTQYSSQNYIYNCYVSEYDAFSVFDSSELHRALDGRGKVSEDGHLKLENSGDDEDKYIVRFTVPLLIAAAVLFIIDIIIRKLTIDDLKSFFGFGKGKRKEAKK